MMLVIGLCEIPRKGRIEMKRILALFVLLAFSIVMISCANTEEGFEPEAGNIDTEETESPLFSADSIVKLTPKEESEIILAYAHRINDSAPDESQYTVYCFAVSDSDEYGKAYAVLVERPGYEQIDFESYFAEPYDYPITREYFDSYGYYDFWFDMRAPLLIYKEGEFYGMRESLQKSVVNNGFLREVNEIYRSLNEDFYVEMGIWTPEIETTSP